ncbi:MAG: hypothetical protein ABUS54_00510 [Actinomycetota bacterium]
MSGWLFAIVVVGFVVAAFLTIRSRQRGRIVEHLPLAPDERVLLEEEGLKVFHRFRRRSVGGGGTTTHRVRAVLTDRRVIVATGGPDGKHAFVIVLILDYSTEARPVAGEGYAAYLEKFALSNGYPTYPVSAADVTIEDGALRVVVPFPEAGARWGPPPEVKLYTQQAETYRAAIDGR